MSRTSLSSLVPGLADGYARRALLRRVVAHAGGDLDLIWRQLRARGLVAWGRGAGMSYCFLHDAFRFRWRGQWICGRCAAEAGHGRVEIRAGRSVWVPAPRPSPAEPAERERT